MITFDSKADASNRGIPDVEKERRFIEDVVRLLHAHSPTPIYTGDLLNIYSRYFRHGRIDRQFNAFQAFMMKARFARYFEVSYVEDMPFRVTLRKTKHVQKILGLPPCMQTVNRCMMRECRHSDVCEIYIVTMNQVRRGPRRDGRREAIPGA